MSDSPDPRHLQPMIASEWFARGAWGPRWLERRLVGELATATLLVVVISLASTTTGTVATFQWISVAIAGLFVISQAHTFLTRTQIRVKSLERHNRSRLEEIPPHNSAGAAVALVLAFVLPIALLSFALIVAIR
jgi:hypothetical protein